MKRKLLFSCEKQGQIFCTSICRHLPPLTRHAENWFCFKVAAPSAACQSVADMRDLWMKPESMRSVSAALLHLPACEHWARWKSSNENITTGHVGYVLIWITEKRIYLHFNYSTMWCCCSTLLTATSMCSPSNDPALLNIKGMHRFEFITRQHGSHMCHLTSDAPFEHMEVLTEPLSGMPEPRCTSGGQRAHIKLSLWKFTSGVWSPLHTPQPLRQHSHISSSVLQRQGAPAQVGRSGSICCYYFPLIIGLNNGMPVSPLPLKPYTLFIFQRSHFCSPFSLALSDCLTLPSISPSPPLYSLPSPSVTSPLSCPCEPFERVSHENDIFDWPHQYVSLSIWRHSPDFVEGLSSHSPVFFLRQPPTTTHTHTAPHTSAFLS